MKAGDEGLFFHVEGFGFGDVVVLLAGKNASDGLFDVLHLFGHFDLFIDHGLELEVDFLEIFESFF